MNRKFTIFALLLIFTFGVLLQLFVMSPKNVLANELPIETKVEAETTSYTPKTESMFENSEDPLDPGIPEVSTDDISNWVDKKGFEIVSILQTFVQPFAIVIMIGCAFMTMIGVFGNQKLLAGGIIGMFIAMTVYVVVLYTPEIMDWFLMWVRN